MRRCTAAVEALAKRFEMSNLPFMIDPLFFGTLNQSQQKLLFKKNVELVSIETHSKCNRRCWFCPNAHHDRHSQNKEMTDALFHKILDELTEIRYDGALSLSGNNEPLLDPNFAERRVRLAKAKLPNARLMFFTNGDYLSPGVLKRLVDEGIDYIYVSLYADYHKELYSFEKAEALINSLAKKLNVAIEFESRPNEHFCKAYGKAGGSTAVSFSSNNHRTTSVNRADAVAQDAPIPKRTNRNKVCSYIFNNIVIGYDGSVLFCCQIINDYPAHRNLIMANLNDQTCYEAFASDKFKQFRLNHVSNINMKPCGDCAECPDADFIYNAPLLPHISRPWARSAVHCISPQFF